MKYLSLIISSIALILAGTVFFNQQSGRKANSTSTAVSSTDSMQAEAPTRIAYVDLDSLDAKFEYYKSKIEAFDKKKEGLDRRLNSAYQQLDNKRIEFLKKGNAITQAEADAFKREYDQQLQYLENERRKSEQEVQQEAMIMRDDVFSKINEFLTGYSKEKGFTYVFSYSRNANLFLYNAPVYNITDEVLTGLNEMYKKPEQKQESKKK